MACAGSDEEDEAAAFGYAADDFAGAAQVGGCYVETDDVDRVLFAADTEDVLGVGGMPEAGGMADVRLAREEQFEGDVLRRRGVGYKLVRSVVRFQCATKVLSASLLVVEEFPITDDLLIFQGNGRGLRGGSEVLSPEISF